jgi:phosphatidylglycerol lysyltransferase
MPSPRDAELDLDVAVPVAREAGGGARARLGRILRIAFAAAMLATALWVIADQLKGASLAQVDAALAATPAWAIGVCIATTILSYITLATSDWWALELIGKRLSAWRIGVVSFASYAASNALGFSLATGGAMRLRFYGAMGLSRRAVVAVTLLAGLAVTLSGVVTAGLALLATGGLPRWTLPVALALLAPAILWLIPLPKRAPFLKREIFTPPLRNRIVALGCGVLDWIFSGLALFVLMPNPALANLAPFLAVFVLGSIVSAASGVPGGVGVFEAVVLALGDRFAPGGVEGAAALLLYRLIYAAGPFLLVALALAALQARKRRAISE